MSKKAVKKGHKPQIITTFEVEADVLNRLRRLAKLEDVSVSHFIRKGLGLYVESRLKARDASAEVKAVLMGKA
jgi:hypothetical protein